MQKKGNEYSLYFLEKTFPIFFSIAPMLSFARPKGITFCQRFITSKQTMYIYVKSKGENLAANIQQIRNIYKNFESQIQVFFSGNSMDVFKRDFWRFHDNEVNNPQNSRQIIKKLVSNRNNFHTDISPRLSVNYRTQKI